MVQVKDCDLDLPLRREPVQDVEQYDRISAAGDGDSKPGAGWDHVITSDDFLHPFY